jgi:hypothetical protein
MTCREYGLYTRIRELQSKFGFVWFDGDDLAKGFQKTPRSTLFADCRALVKAGWFEVKDAPDRKTDGTWKSRKIVALNHKEWASKNPSECQKIQDSQSISETGPFESNGLVQSNRQTDQSNRWTDRSISWTDHVSLIDKDLVQGRHGSTQKRIKSDMERGGPENEVFSGLVPTLPHDSQGTQGSPEIHDTLHADAKEVAVAVLKHLAWCSYPHPEDGDLSEQAVSWKLEKDLRGGKDSSVLHFQIESPIPVRMAYFSHLTSLASEMLNNGMSTTDLVEKWTTAIGHYTPEDDFVGDDTVRTAAILGAVVEAGNYVREKETSAALLAAKNKFEEALCV